MRQSGSLGRCKGRSTGFVAGACGPANPALRDRTARRPEGLPRYLYCSSRDGVAEHIAPQSVVTSGKVVVAASRWVRPECADQGMDLTRIKGVRVDLHAN